MPQPTPECVCVCVAACRQRVCVCSQCKIIMTHWKSQYCTQMPNRYRRKVAMGSRSFGTCSRTRRILVNIDTPGISGQIQLSSDGCRGRSSRWHNMYIHTLATLYTNFKLSSFPLFTVTCNKTTAGTVAF
jgi:hypothetical protein